MMKYKYVLLAGTVVPGLLLLASPTVAAPGSDDGRGAELSGAE